MEPKNRCLGCGCVFGNDEARRRHYIGGETEMFCPECDNDDFEDVLQCDGCGEWFNTSDLYGAQGDLYCLDCLEDMATAETAKAVGKDNPMEINGFFGQFFSESEAEAILMEAVEKLHTTEQIEAEAALYCTEDPHYFADWLINHDEEGEA